MFKWDETEAIIPAVVSIPERADSVRQLLIDLSKQCPGITATVIPQWKKNSKDTPRLAFESITRGLRRVSCPWVFYMEEDIQLSSKFGELVPGILDKIDDDCGMVSFFSQKKADKRLLDTGVNLYKPGETFAYSQCVAMRLDVALAWRDMLLPWWDSAPAEHKRAPDIALGQCCRGLGFRILIYIPNLVQHRQILSGFGHDCRHPHSYTFLE